MLHAPSPPNPRACNVHYQSDVALTEELQALSPEAARRLSLADVIALYLRRQRLAFMGGRERHGEVLASLPKPWPLQGPPVHVLLLGDDGLRPAVGTKACATEHTKRSLAAMLTRRQFDPNNHAAHDVFELTDPEEDRLATSPLTAAAAYEAGEGERVLVLAPSLAPPSMALSKELFAWCDVVVACYNADRTESFQSLIERWLPLRREAVSRLQCESQALASSASHTSVSGWLSSGGGDNGPALILVGLRDACPSSSRSEDATVGTRVSRAQAEALAAQVHAARLVELYKDNAAQAAILIKHCVMAREAAYEDYPLSVRESFLNAKAAALRLLLRAPPPSVAKQALSDDGNSVVLTFRVAQLDPARSDWRGNATTGGAVTEGLRMWRVHEGGREPLTQRTITLAVGKGDEVVVVYATGRCLYHSERQTVQPPSPGAVPAGFFDAARRCFQRCVLGQVQGGGAASVPMQYLLTAPTEGEVGEDGLELAEEADGSGRVALLPHGALESVHEGGLWRPWPSDEAAASAKLIVTACSTATEAGGLSRVFDVPKVLPTPAIRYDAAEATVHLSPFPPPPHVELRYTLDNTEPTITSALYTAPISLVGWQGWDSGAPVVRAAAFPKVYFASREAVLRLDGSGSPGGGVGSVPVVAAAADAASGRSLTSPSLFGFDEAVRAPVAAQWAATGAAAAVPAPATTRAQKLRQAFHTGSYTPPYVPFLSGKPEEAVDQRHQRRSRSQSAATRRSRASDNGERKSRSQVRGGVTVIPRTGAEKGSRVVELPPFEPPLCLSHVVFQVAREPVASPEEQVVYCLEGRHPRGTQYVTLAWGTLAHDAGPQTVFIPSEVECLPVRWLRCTLRCPESERALERIVKVTPFGQPAV